MIGELRKDCIKYASLLGDYQNITTTELADGYCKAIDDGNTNNQSKYLCALVLRFWYTIDRMKQKGSGLAYDYDEFAEWLIEAINYACKYRAWQDPTKNVGAQQAIHQCINTIRLQHYYNLNLNKNKANVNNVSLDTPIQGDTDDHANTLLDSVGDTSTEYNQSKLNTELIVQSFIDDKKIIEAIIIDTIAFNNVEKETKKIVKELDEDGKVVKRTKIYKEFWPYKLVQILSTLPEDYTKYFSTKYHIVPQELAASLGTIKAANNQKLYKYLTASLAVLKSRLIDAYN